MSRPKAISMTCLCLILIVAFGLCPACANAMQQPQGVSLSQHLVAPQAATYRSSISSSLAAGSVAYLRLWKFLDWNGDADWFNGFGNPEDYGIPNWSFTIQRKGDGSQPIQMLTGPDGDTETAMLSVNSIGLTTFIITEEYRPGWVKTCPYGSLNPYEIQLSAGEVREDWIGSWQPIYISGFELRDNAPWPWTYPHWVGANGQQNTSAWEPTALWPHQPLDEGIGNIKIDLYNRTGLVKLETKLSNSDGTFRFGPLQWDQYYFSVDGPEVSSAPKFAYNGFPAVCSKHNLAQWAGATYHTVAIWPSSIGSEGFSWSDTMSLRIEEPKISWQDYGGNAFFNRKPSRIWGLMNLDALKLANGPIVVRKDTAVWPGGDAVCCTTCGFYAVSSLSQEPEGIRPGNYTLKPATLPDPTKQEWLVTRWSVDGANQLVPTTTVIQSGGIYSVENLTSGVDARVDFSIQLKSGSTTYSINSSAGTGGSISPNGALVVSAGATKTFAIEPYTNYRIDSVKVDNIDQGAKTSYTFTNVKSNHTISAAFSLSPTYTITSSAGSGGSISPNGANVVSAGVSKTFTISPNVNYRIDSVKVDNIDQGTITSYTFTNVNANHTISATFIFSPTYYINISAGSGGSISPGGTVSVSAGVSKTFTITPNANYQIENVNVDSQSVGAISSYTFTNVSVNHTISATFSPISSSTFIITSSAGIGGSISPNGANVVSSGASKTYTITPNANYQIENVNVDGQPAGAISSYTFTSVSVNHTISATFSPISSSTFTITSSAGIGGSISPNGANVVSAGASKTFTITPDANYQIENVNVDSQLEGAISVYTFTNITANHSISATFSVTGGGGGDDQTQYLPVTFTQAGWKAYSDISNTTIPSGMIYTRFPLAFANFSYYNKIYRNSIVVGKGKTISFLGTTSNLKRLILFLPQNGPAGKLDRNYTNPWDKTSSGVLGGEVIALQLNIAYNDRRLMTRQGCDLEYFTLSSGYLMGKTVGEVLDIGNAVLGGTLPYRLGLPKTLDLGYGALVDILQSINSNYEYVNSTTFTNRGYLIPNVPYGTAPSAGHDPFVPYGG